MPFTFDPRDAIYQPPPLIPKDLIILAMREALNAVQVRITFIGHPSEPKTGKGWPDLSRPDWSNDCSHAMSA